MALGDHRERSNCLNDLPNATEIYALYSVMFPQSFSIRRKSVIFTAVLAGEPWSWQVIGISQAALEALSINDFRYMARTVCRAHLIDRIATANAIFNIPGPLSNQALFSMLVKTGLTIITTKAENKLASRLPYLSIDSARGLFLNQLISFTHRRNERNALRELYSDFNNGRVSLVQQDSGNLAHLPLHAKKRTMETAPQADGKKVIQGTIGESKYLLDAGNGEIVLELKSNLDVAKQAAATGRVLVPRRDASAYAVRSLIRRWNQAKNDEPHA